MIGKTYDAGKKLSKTEKAEWVKQETAAKTMKMKAETPMKTIGKTPIKDEPDLISDDDDNGKQTVGGSKKKKFAMKKIKMKTKEICVQLQSWLVLSQEVA